MEGRGLFDCEVAALFFRDADRVARRPSALMAFPVFYTSTQAGIVS